MMEDVDSFLSAFPKRPARRGYHDERSRKERLTVLTEKERQRERKRAAVRTAQINFRCTPVFKDKVLAVKVYLGLTVPDMMDAALDMLAKKKGYKGG